MSLDERLKSEGDVNYEAIMGYYDEAVDKPQAAAEIMGIPPRRMGGIELRAQVSDFVLDLSYEEMKEIEQELGIDPHSEIDEVDQYCSSCLKEYLVEYNDKLEEAEYRGRKVSLGKPFLTPGGPKKRSVYVKNAKGNVVKVNFGDPNMRIKKSIPARRKSYRARHHCQSPGPKWKANYWSCKAW